MLDILDIDNDVVFNTMIDNSTIECIALVPDERQAKVLVRDPRQNVRQAYTKSRRIDFRGKSTGDHGFREGRQPRLVLDHKQALADLNLEVKHAEQEAISAKAKKDAEVAKEAKLKRMGSRYEIQEGGKRAPAPREGSGRRGRVEREREHRRHPGIGH